MTKVEFKKVTTTDKVSFVENGKTKFVEDKLVVVNNTPIGVRKVHTGNSNYIVVKVMTRVENGSRTNDKGEVVPVFTDMYKDTVVFHPAAKVAKRVLHNIR